MIFVILAAAAVLIGSLLWIDHRACRRRMYHAAPVIPVDDALAAYCEQYIVCDDDVETVCDDDRNDSGGPACQDSSPSTGGRDD